MRTLSADPAEPPSTAARIGPRRRDRLLVAAFFALWLVPVFWHGAVSQHRIPGEPALLHDCHNIACLFTTRPRSWNAYYVQVRSQGRPDWQTLDLGKYFPMEPFGHRTRLHRFLIHWGPERARGREEVAAYLFARHHALHPERRQPDELRFVWTWTAPQADRPPEGAWQPPPVEKLPANRMRILSMHRRETPP